MASDAQTREGPWLSNEALSRLPKVGASFQRNRDPYIARQLEDLNRSEAERRRTGSGERGEQGDGRANISGSYETPAPHHRPPPSMRRGVDQSDFSRRWLAAQRDAALAQAKPPTSSNAPARERGADYGPQYGPSR